MAASSLSVAVADSGHTFAMTAAASSLSPAAMLSETFGGISQVSRVIKTCTCRQWATIIKH